MRCYRLFLKYLKTPIFYKETAFYRDLKSKERAIFILWLKNLWTPVVFITFTTML
jgi:hypothetical protein